MVKPTGETFMPHLNFLSFYGSALQVGARTARLHSMNIANADTPGYQARGIDFAEALNARLDGETAATPAQYVRGLPIGLDGNNVSLDYESVQASANAARQRESLACLKRDTEMLITALQPQSNGQGG
jgi:flagellar basal-body rod protein FlgB